MFTEDKEQSSFPALVGLGDKIGCMSVLGSADVLAPAWELVNAATSGSASMVESAGVIFGTTGTWGSGIVTGGITSTVSGIVAGGMDSAATVGLGVDVVISFIGIISLGVEVVVMEEGSIFFLAASAQLLDAWN